MRLETLASAEIVILGYGREGRSTHEFLRARFPDKTLIIADQKLPNYEASVRRADVIVKTAGIPLSLPLLRGAVLNGARLTSHMEIFFSNYPRDLIVGVTGTKGKSTTTTLLYEMVKAAGKPCVLAGNIGAPPLTQVNIERPEALVVCELSSHQLQPLRMSPHVAVLTNIVPEHLDYYATFAEYAAAKENITRFQTPDDVLVYGGDNEVCRRIASRTKARTVSVRADDGIVESVLPVADVPLRGKFNLANVAAAIAAARALDVPDAAMRSAITAFKGLPHRLEYVGRFKGIDFYDDSIATVPEAAALAIDALGPGVQTLIAGGHDRHLTFEVLADAIVKSSIETLILFPPTGEKIAAALKVAQGFSAAGGGRRFSGAVLFVESMEQAVRLAYEHTAAGRICLLSPASASFGTFVDYADRGQQFAKWIRSISGAA